MKDIVLICNSFYGYENDIIKKIERNGDKCTYFNSNFPFSNVDRIMKHINYKYINNKINNYFKQFLNSINKCDVLLVIFSPLLTLEFIKDFRKKFPNAKLIYYSWDSVCNFENIKQIANYSDKAYSFDKNDCANYNFEFLPLFCPENIDSQNKNKYDYSMIFSLYPKKVKNYRMIKKLLPNDLKGYTHIFVNKKMYYYYKIFFKVFRPINKSEINFNTLSKDKVYEIFNNSNIIIDCPLEGQAGLTIRTFEALKMNKKIITTNKDIKSYDFYDDNFIFVIDENTKTIPESFFENKLNVEYKFLENYSLKRFIEKLLS